VAQKTKTAAPVTEKKTQVVTTEVRNNPPEGGKLPEKKRAVKRTLEDVILVEQRISQIEQSQKKTREQIQKFTVVKEELTRSKEEAEKHIVKVTQQSYLTNRQLQEEITSLTAQLQLSEARYENLKKEIDTAHYQTERETKSLTEQLQAALEKQTQLEKERARLFRSRGSEGFWNGLLIGLGISMVAIATFLVIALMTPWLEPAVCHSQNVQTSPPLPDEESKR
jgi:chromosome segregation ATPase